MSDAAGAARDRRRGREHSDRGRRSRDAARAARGAVPGARLGRSGGGRALSAPLGRGRAGRTPGPPRTRGRLPRPGPGRDRGATGVDVGAARLDDLSPAACGLARLSGRRRSSALRRGADFPGPGFSHRRRARGRARNPDAGAAISERLDRRSATRADIARGLALLRAIGPFDVGQAVVVADNQVLAVEAVDGTDNMLERIAELRARGRVATAKGVGVLIKAPKPAQDRRLDMPAIGPRTVEAAARAGLAGIAVVAGEHDHRRAAAGRPRGRCREAVRLRHRRAVMTQRRPADHGPSRRRRGVGRCARRRADARAARPRPGIRFGGLGGRAMAEQGIASPFDIHELSIIGFGAVLRQLPRILRRIRQTADAVIAARPDALVIIDSPDFTHRVARRVRKAAPDIPIINYAPPSVWVWRPWRARAMRRYVDEVLAILPFEPDAFARLDGPHCTYVGHPLAERLSRLAAERRGGAAAPGRSAAGAGAARKPAQRNLAGSPATFGEAIAQVAARVRPARAGAADAAAHCRAGRARRRPTGRCARAS